MKLRRKRWSWLVIEIKWVCGSVFGLDCFCSSSCSDSFGSGGV
ncbi:unnamed protein product [Arabidopsis halleri]